MQILSTDAIRSDKCLLSKKHLSVICLCQEVFFLYCTSNTLLRGISFLPVFTFPSFWCPCFVVSQNLKLCSTLCWHYKELHKQTYSMSHVHIRSLRNEVFNNIQFSCLHCNMKWTAPMLDGRVYLASLGMEQLLHDDIASQFSVKYIIFV